MIEIFTDEKSLKKKIMAIKTDSRLPAEPNRMPTRTSPSSC